MNEFLIPADLDVGSADTVLENLKAWIQNPNVEMGKTEVGADDQVLELTETDPTQIALQVLIAGVRELEKTNFQDFLGGNARSVLATEKPFEGNEL